MPKKYLTIAISIILVSCLVYAYFYLSNFKNFKNNDCIKAVPADASIIIKSSNTEKIAKIFLNDVKYKDALDNFSCFYNLSTTLGKYLNDTQFNHDVINQLKRKPLTISVHREGKNKVQPLFILPLSNKAEQNKLKNYLKILDDSIFTLNERKYNTSTLYTLKLNSNQKTIFISFKSGFLLASNSSILVENSLRQLQTGYSLLSDKTFNKVYKTVGNNSGANVFINFDNISESLGLLFNKEYKEKLDVTNRIAKWGEFDINLKKNQILVNGFLYSASNDNDINLLFKGLNSESSEINKVIPANSNYILSFSFSNTKKLKNNFQNYLKLNKKLNSYRKKISKLNLNLSQEELDNIVFNILNDEFALVYSEYNPLEKDNGKYLIIKTNSKSKTLKEIKRLNNNADLNPSDYYMLDDQTSYPIYTNLKTDIFNITLDYFCQNTPRKYFTFIDNYLIFADSKKSLSTIIYANILKKTLRNNKYHQQFLENFSYKENIFLYCDLTQISNILHNAGNFELLNPNKEQKNALSKFYGIGIQLSNANDLLYTNVCLQYLPNREKEPQTIWQSKLDSTIITKPSLVENHYTKEKEIFVQDKTNMIYLIANNGRVLWKKKLDAPILSEVYQIDYYRNNKLQYLFNTPNKIYLLDRNGNSVEKYPINLAHKATNGIALFDYDKNRNYRIFVACENKKTYVFNKKGRIISGWKANATEGIVTKPIQHFRIQNKDYIVISDNIRNYILNRRGENRVNVNPDFISNKNSNFYSTNNKSQPIIMTTDIQGNLRKIDLSTGKSITQELLNSEEKHHFMVKNMTRNDGSELILITKEEVLLTSNKGKTLFKTEIDGNILPVADTYHFSNSNKKIGVFDSTNKKIYLINNDGTIYKNFPLKGQSRFSIGFLNSSSNKFNLIVAGEDNYLYNYQIE